MAKNKNDASATQLETDDAVAVQQATEKTTTAEQVASQKPEKVKKEKDKKQKPTKMAKNGEAKKSRVKETFAELKKVSWPTFGKTMKQTGMVLSIVLLFGVVVFGFDVLISYLLKLVSLI